jgi:hypothetical protein
MRRHDFRDNGKAEAGAMRAGVIGASRAECL